MDVESSIPSSKVGGPNCPGMREVIFSAAGVETSMRDSSCRAETSFFFLVVTLILYYPYEF